MPFWVQGSKITLFEKYVEGRKVVFELKLDRNLEIGEKCRFSPSIPCYHGFAVSRFGYESENINCSLYPLGCSEIFTFVRTSVWKREAVFISFQNV